jgi:hypothetical protein
MLEPLKRALGEKNNRMALPINVVLILNLKIILGIKFNGTINLE